MWRHSDAEEAGDSKRRDRFLSMLAQVASCLNMARDREQAMREMLPLLGETPDIDRIAIHQIDVVQASFSSRFEWRRASGQVRPGPPELQQVPFATSLPTWLPRLLQGEAIYGPLTAQAESEQSYLKTRNSESFLVVPIFVGDRLWGMLGFNNSEHARFWSETEVSIFGTIALNLSSAFERFDQAERLQQSEARFRALYNQSVQLTGLLTPAGLIEDSNDTVCQALGLRAEVLQGQTIWDLPVWPDEATRRALRAAVARAAAGEHVRQEFCLDVKGRRIWLDYALTPVFDTDGRVTVLISEGRDISLQKQNEQAMRERAREIECLYEISRRADVPDLDLEAYFASVVELVPQAFQSPEQTWARLAVADQVYDSRNFHETDHCTSSVLRSEAREIGYLQVCLGPDGPGFSADELVFLEEVNRILARILERVEARAGLVELNAELEARVEQRSRALAVGEALMRHLIDSLPDMVFYKDLEGRYLGCNRAFELFSGISQADLIGRCDEELFTVELLPEIWRRDEWSQSTGLSMLESWREIFAVEAPLPLAGEIFTREDWVYSLAGPRLFLETRKTCYTGPEGEPVGLIAISRDLTRRKLAENAMQENEAKFRQLIDTLPVGVLVFDVSGNTFFSNKAAIRMLGDDLPAEGRTEDLVKLKYRNCLAGTDQDYPPERHPLTRAYVGKEISEISDLEVVHQDGRRIPMYVSGTPVLDDKGDMMYAITAFSDISELKRKEDELIVAREKAEAASRAKSDFLANMSHEIRTPMNAIIGLNHLLLRSGLAAKQTDHVHKIQSAAQNLLGIINDILDFSKIEAGKLGMERIPFDLQQVIVNLSNLLSLRAQEKGLELIIRLQPDLPTDLIGDPLRLEQVLLNLAGNAIKFTASGEVEVRVDLLDLEADRAHLGFRIRDTGIGIAPDEQGKLFQAFSQADTSTTRKYGGTGLGLTISKRLIELMRGEIGFSSESGRGSEFWFSAWFGRQSSPVGVALSVPPNLRGKRVLAVDDYQAVLELIREYLRDFDFVLDTAATPEEALGLVRQREAVGEGYDLLLMDWMLPGQNGFDLIEACWAMTARRPRTILMTAYGRDNVFVQAEGLGIDAILLKPLTPSLLWDAVMQAFGGVRQLQTQTSKAYAGLLDPVRGARILLVEDNEINQTVARELLEAEGFEVDGAWNGREAVERLIPQAGSAQTGYDLVLMDIHMPEMDGYAATRALRAQPGLAGLPIVAMTADAVTGIRDEVLAVGMNDFVTKPIDLGELFSALARWIPAQDRPAQPRRRESGTEIPPLPGIEAAEALQRLGGNVGLYLKLLKRFGIELPDKLDELAAALGRRDVGQAHQIAHTLKGTAGNLGVVALQARMASLEPALKAADWPSAELVFEQTWQQVQSQLLDLAQLSLPDPEPCPSPDPARNKQLIKQLGEALQNYDPSAGDILQQLALCLDRPEQCRELEALIDDFDFEAALLCWQRLEPQLMSEEPA